MRSELRADRIEALEAENARLKAELELLRPKPVVKTVTKLATIEGFYDGWDTEENDNLKLTFTDGKLTKAEVIG